MTLYNKMNVYLANLTIFYKKVHNLHWNVKGHNFFGLHQKYDDLYNEFQDKIDEVAERLLSLGQTPVSNYKEVLALGTIKERESKPVAGLESVEIFLKDLEALIKETYELIELCAEKDDPGSEDLFTGYLKDYEKHRWMFESIIEKV